MSKYRSGTIKKMTDIRNKCRHLPGKREYGLFFVAKSSCQEIRQRNRTVAPQEQQHWLTFFTWKEGGRFNQTVDDTIRFRVSDV